jgi:hypothetical protein
VSKCQEDTNANNLHLAANRIHVAQTKYWLSRASPSYFVNLGLPQVDLFLEAEWLLTFFQIPSVCSSLFLISWNRRQIFASFEISF